MSVIVMRRKFETIPASTDIMQLLFGQDSGDRDKAKDALQTFLTPVKDLLDLLYLVDQMKATAERHIELLKEQENLTAEIATSKSTLTVAKSNYDKVTTNQIAKAGVLSDEIAKLEKTLAGLEDEQATRDRLNKVVVAEVAENKKGLLAAMDKDVTKAKDKLIGLTALVETAEQQLATLAEQKRQFIASLG